MPICKDIESYYCVIKPIQKIQYPKMKAVVYTKYGERDVLKLIDIPKPTPKANEVLIKIHTTTVNRTDVGFRRGKPLIARLFAGLLKPKFNVLGSEFSGIIEAIGKDVNEYKKGDEVFGIEQDVFGAHTEYICLSADKAFALKPQNMNLEEAGSICEGLFLAQNYIKELDFKKVKSIMVNGATGSIGSAFIQLAKYHGARITATARVQHFDLVKSIGASEVIDYETADFTLQSEQFDMVMDAVGKSSFFACKRILKPDGIYFSTEFGPYYSNAWLPLTTKLFSKRQVKFPIPTVKKSDIEFYKKIIEEGHYQAIIDKKYTLETIQEAYKYVESEQKVGNVIISISD